VCFFASQPVDVIVDINGWFVAGAGFVPVGPERVFDTRPAESPAALRTVAATQVSPGGELEVQMLGLPGGITPAGGVSAVSLNVAVTNSSAAGFVTVHPCGSGGQVASLNYTAGQTISNAVVVAVPADGRLCFFSFAPADLVVDINGWFTAGPGFVPAGPARVFDTRPGQSVAAMRTVPAVQVGPDQQLMVQMSGLSGGAGVITPSTGVGAVSLNVAVTNPSAAGFVTVFPCGTRREVASVNYSATQTVSNAVIVPVSATGQLCFFSLVPTDLVVDINGWFPA
jgi:hypothetical protein